MKKNEEKEDENEQNSISSSHSDEDESEESEEIPSSFINKDNRKKIIESRTSAAFAYSPQNKLKKKISKISVFKFDSRGTNKKSTHFADITGLNDEKIEYPIQNLKPIPILLSEKKELIYLYFAEEEAEYFLDKINRKNAYFIKEEDITIKNKSLQYFLPTYFNQLYRKKNFLEERLSISMSDKMEHIKPNYTIAIEMDEKLKNSKIIKKQRDKYSFVKKDILKHIDINQKGVISFDPFSKIKIKEKVDDKEDEIQTKAPLPKWAISLKKGSDDEDDDDLQEGDSESENEEEILEDEQKFDRKYVKRLSISNKDIQHLSLLRKSSQNDLDEIVEENINENDENAKKDEKVKKDEKLENMVFPYKKYIKKLFYPKLEKFRKNLIDILLENSYQRLNFEKFIFFIEFYITLFTGIQVKYSIDELGFLNMDLYASELMFMNMAEILHYQVQFQIRDISHHQSNKEKINQNLIIELNNRQYEDFDKNKIEFFPPSTAFIQELCNHFRRYTKNDNYHLCEKCEKLFSENNYIKAECDSSVFRFIDKVRLLLMTLSGVMNISYLEKMIELNANEDNEESNIFKGTMILRNEDVFNKFEIISIIKTYLCPIITKQIAKLNNTFRNIFGEVIGYYYTWVSHYIFWLIFPAIFGLISEILNYFFKSIYIQNYVDIIFLSFFLLWGFYYVRNWRKKEKFFNHIWGMDSFKAEITNLYDENYSKVSYVNFLGMEIPKIDKISALMINIISILLVLISSLFIMGINVGIFKINKVDNFLFVYLNKIFSYIGVSKEISRYTLPILIYIAREIISKIFYKISAILAKLERPTDKEEYDEIVTKKRLTLEFVNYYFNLYYIMFYKKMKNKCEDDDCFQEVRKQLLLILLSNISMVIIQFIYKIIYMRKNIKNFEIKVKKAFEKNSDVIEKLKFYTRELFTEDNIQQLIIPIIFNFGYVIQFGICCPISFLFMLILIIFIRLTDAISMIYVYYVKTLSISKGLLVYNKTQQLFMFIGIFSNLSLLFYTRNPVSDLKLIYKLIIIAVIQNGVIIICNIIRFKSLPFWFRYRKIIKLKYLKKFGVIQNKNNCDNNKDNNKENTNDEDININNNIREQLKFN